MRAVVHDTAAATRRDPPAMGKGVAEGLDFHKNKKSTNRSARQSSIAICRQK
jgi:hypothetical protein